MLLYQNYFVSLAVTRAGAVPARLDLRLWGVMLSKREEAAFADWSGPYGLQVKEEEVP